MRTSLLVKKRSNLKSFFKQKIYNHPFLVVSIVHAVILLGIYTLINYQMYLDSGGLERWFALTMLNGHQLPYRDFIAEYPPLAYLTFILPALFFREPLSYALAFATELFIADVIILYFLLKICNRMQTPVWETLGAYTLILISIGSLVMMRHDLIPAMLTVITLYCIISGKQRTTWLFLGLGIITKIYPAVLVPFLGILLLVNQRFRANYRNIALLGAVILIGVLPWVIIGYQGFMSFVGYHADRGLQSESSYATFLLVGQLLGLTAVKGIFNFSSWNLSSPLADKLAYLSTYIMAIALIVTYAIFAWQMWKVRYNLRSNKFMDTETALKFIKFTVVSVLVLILTDKVFSPQYLIWVGPLLVLIRNSNRYWIWLLFVIAGIMTQYVFPFNYGAYQAGEAIPVAIEASRNALLIIITFILVFSDRLNIKVPIRDT